MSRIYPNIVPENNLRLPDALTIKHGPAPLLSKFVLEGDKAVRAMGIRLHLRHDFGELVYLNKGEVVKGNWFPVVNMFNPEYCELTPENSYWISGENENGEIVLTLGGRIYYWPETSLEEEARGMFYATQAVGKTCIVTAPAAKMITGVVYCGGAHWVRPDYRGHRLSHLIPRMGRAYVLARWPVDWAIGLVAPILEKKGVTGGYGYKNVSYSIFYPGSRWGDLEVGVAYIPVAEVYRDLDAFLGAELSAFEGGRGFARSSRRTLDEAVTKVSSVPTLHGSNSLS